MAKRVTSDTGAYMSQYDQEVETRLDRLEAAVAALEVKVSELQDHTHTTPAPTDGGDPALAEKFESLITTLNTVPTVTQWLPKVNGERKLDV